MRKNKARLAVLLFLGLNLLLAACARGSGSAAAGPEADSSAIATPAPMTEPEPETTPEPSTEPTPEPTPEPDDGWREAYAAEAEQFGLEFPEQNGGGARILYSLIDFDGDDTPELAAVLDGYCVSLYTYADGEVYMLMDRWAYGAMGNAGYEYCPGKNSLRNYNSDYAGLIMYTTYMSISPDYTMEMTAQIETYNFDDVNGNGVPDENEYDSAFNYCVSYYDGEEISDEAAAAFDAGEYEYIEGTMSFDELIGALAD